MNLQIFCNGKLFPLAFFFNLFIFLGISQNLQAQVVSDNNGAIVEETGGAVTTAIQDFIIPQGSDRILVVFVEWISVSTAGGADLVDSVTYNGQHLTHLETEKNVFFGTTNGVSSIYYLEFGTGCAVTENNDIEVFLNNTSTSIFYASAITFQNVDQTTPIGNTMSISNSSATASINLPTTSTDNMVIDGIMAFATVTADASQDTVFTVMGSGAGASYEQATGAGTVMDWTLSVPIVYAHVAAELNHCATCNPFGGGPFANASATQITCSNPNSTLDGAGSTAGSNISYEWNKISGIGNLVGDSTMITATADGTGIFRIFVLDTNTGCVDFDDVVVLEDLSTPTATATSTLVDCFNPMSTLDGTGSSTGANITYQWSKISGGGNLVGPTNNINASADGDGVFRLTVTKIDNGCSDFFDVTVIADLTAPVATATASMIDCFNPTSMLDGTGSDTGANITYQWSKVSGIGNLVGPTNAITAIADAAGVFRLTVTNNTNGCTSIAEPQATGNTTPPNADAGNSQQIDCANTTVLLDGTGSSQGSGETYQWTGPNVITGGTTLTPEVGDDGVYTLTVTAVNGCVETSDVTVIEDLAAPTADAGDDKDLVCDAIQISLDGTNSSQGVPFTYNWTGPNVQAGANTLTPIVAQPGTYTLTVLNNDNSCTSTSDAEVVVIPSPTASIASQTNVDCFGNNTGSAVATGVNGRMPYNFSWSSGSNTFIQTNLGIGTYDVTLTDNDGCTSTTSVTITQPDTLTTSATSTFVTSPNSNDGTATALPVGGTPPYMYSWSNGGTTETITGLAPNYYTVTVTDDNGCQAIHQILVNVDLVVQISADGPTTICFGENVTLTANASNTVTYDWNNGSTNESISVMDSGIYAVTVTDQFGITATNNVFVDVLPLPTVTITPDGPNQFCEGGSVTLTASGAVSYVWDDPNNTTGPELTATATAGYTVFGTGTNGCVGEETFSVTAFPLPDVMIASATGFEFCEGTSVELEAVANNIADFYWSTGDTNMVFITVSETQTISLTAIDGNGCVNSTTETVTEISEPNVQILPGITVEICDNDTTQLQATGGNSFLWSNGETTSIIDVHEQGIYSVTVAAGTGCSGSSSTTVIVNDLPSAAISVAGNTEICDGTNVELTASGGTSYLWSNGETNSMINATGGIYSVTVTDDNSCSSVAEQEIKVLPLPNVEVSPNNPSVCEGESATLTAITDPTNTFLWSTGEDEQNISVDAAGLYDVTVTDNNGCTNTSMVDFVVHAPPAASVSPSDTIIHLGNSALLQASGGTQYLWSTGVTNSSLVVTISGNYSVTVTDDNGCTSVAMATVQVTDAPLVTIQPDGPTEFCEGGTVTLDAMAAGTPNFSFEWSTGSTDPSIQVATSGIYTVTLTDGNGFQALASETVTVNPTPDAPVVSPSGLQNLCEGESLLLTTGNGDIVNWQPGNIASVSLNVSTPGTYYAYYIDGNNCQSEDSDMVTVQVHPIPAAPVVNFSPSTVVCAPETVTLMSNYATGNLWSNGATDQSIVISSGMDVYSVVHTDINGCSSAPSTDLDVTVYPQPDGGITVIGDTEFCQDDSADLMATGGTDYFWNVPGPAMQTITVSSGGLYSVTIVDDNGCEDTVTQNIIVFPLPTPTIVSVADTLYTQSGNTFQWYFDGVALPNTNSQWIVPEETGDFYVVVTDINGCVGTSPVVTDVIQIEDLGQINIYPNPTDLQLFIDMEMKRLVPEINFKLINLLGQVVYTENLQPQSSYFKHGINVDNLPSGTYHLGIEIEDEFYIQKVVISRK